MTKKGKRQATMDAAAQAWKSELRSLMDEAFLNLEKDRADYETSTPAEWHARHCAENKLLMSLIAKLSARLILLEGKVGES
jgi:hypothetical protein